MSFMNKENKFLSLPFDLGNVFGEKGTPFVPIKDFGYGRSDWVFGGCGAIGGRSAARRTSPEYLRLSRRWRGTRAEQQPLREEPENEKINDTLIKSSNNRDVEEEEEEEEKEDKTEKKNKKMTEDEDRRKQGRIHGTRCV